MPVPPRLVDDGNVLCVSIIPSIESVRQDEQAAAGLWFAGVDEARRVRDEFAIKHDRGHIVIERIALICVRLRSGDVAYDATDNIRPRLERFAVLVLGRITLCDHLFGVEA